MKNFALFKNCFLSLGPLRRFFLLPALCTLVDLSILGAIIAPLRQIEMLPQPLTKVQWEHFLLFFILYLLFLFLTHLIFYFSHASFLHGLTDQINGKKPHLLKAMSKTLKAYFPLFLWISFASTIGIFWSLFHSKRLKGQSFGIATFFILPVLVEYELTPLKALEKSSELITDRWGENLRPCFHTKGILMLSIFIAFIPFFITAIMGYLSIGIWLSSILIIFIGTLYVSTRITLIWNLYEFAQGRKISETLNRAELNHAFSSFKIDHHS